MQTNEYRSIVASVRNHAALVWSPGDRRPTPPPPDPDGMYNVFRRHLGRRKRDVMITLKAVPLGEAIKIADTLNAIMARDLERAVAVGLPSPRPVEYYASPAPPAPASPEAVPSDLNVEAPNRAQEATSNKIAFWVAFDSERLLLGPYRTRDEAVAAHPGVKRCLRGADPAGRVVSKNCKSRLKRLGYTVSKGAADEKG